MSKLEHKCWIQMERLLISMRDRGFATESAKAWCKEWILVANTEAAVGNWAEVAVVLQEIENAFYQDWLDANPMYCGNTRAA
jgi:hypothetical protein